MEITEPLTIALLVIALCPHTVGVVGFAENDFNNEWNGDPQVKIEGSGSLMSRATQLGTAALIKSSLFMVFSLTVFFLWPYKPDIISLYTVKIPSAFALALLPLSVSRFYGVRPAVPAPELFVVAYPFLVYFFVNSIPFQIHTVDGLLFSFDRNFGFFEMVLAKLYNQSSILSKLLGMTYDALMLAVTLAYLAMPNTTVRRRFFAAVVLSAVVIFPLYILCPGGGPKYLLYDNGLSMNAMPSGHFAWALLIFWFARKYCGGRAVRVGAGVFMVLTCLATLGNGEHYIIDLIMSVPFAAGIWALVHRQWGLAGSAAGVVLIWLMMLREGWALSIPPVLAWILVGMTIAVFALYNADEDTVTVAAEPVLI